MMVLINETKKGQEASTSSRFIVVSDFHADLWHKYSQSLTNHNNSRFQHQLVVLDEIYKLAQTKQANVVFNGDLFNKRTGVDIKVYHEILAKIKANNLQLKKHNLHTYLVSGNHDQYDNSPVPFNSLEMANLVDSDIKVIEEPTLLKFHNTLALFVPYTYSVKHLNELKDDIKTAGKIIETAKANNEIKASVMFAHLGVSDKNQKGKKLSNGEVSLKNLQADHFTYIALGHYHFRHNLDENGKVFYVGNTIPFNFSKQEVKGVYYLDPEHNQKEFIAIKSPKFITIDLLQDNWLNRIDEIKKLAQNQQNYVRIVLDDTSNLSEAKIKQVNAGLKELSADDSEVISVPVPIDKPVATRLKLAGDKAANPLALVTAYIKQKYPNKPELLDLALATLKEAQNKELGN